MGCILQNTSYLKVDTHTHGAHWMERKVDTRMAMIDTSRSLMETTRIEWPKPCLVEKNKVNPHKIKVSKYKIKVSTYNIIVSTQKIKVSTHILNHPLPGKRYTKYGIRQGNVYPLPLTRTNIYRDSYTMGIIQ